jgi:hypothetical protein
MVAKAIGYTSCVSWGSDTPTPCGNVLYIMATPPYNSSNSMEQLNRRRSIDSVSEVSDTAVSSFNGVQPSYNQQELYQNYPQQQHYQQQQQQQYQQMRPRDYAQRNLAQQYEQSSEVAYSQSGGAGYNPRYTPAQTMPVYNQAYAASEVSYQPPYQQQPVRYQQQQNYAPSSHGSQKPLPSMPPNQMGAPSISDEKSNLNRFSSISAKSVNTERYCCGMFKSKKRCMAICIPLLLFLVIALGVTGFFVWPRVPGFEIGAPVNVNTREFGNIEILRNASPENPFRGRFDLRVDVTVRSENYIPWNINEIRIDGTLIDPERNRPLTQQIGNGTRSNILLQARNTTTFGFVLAIDVDIYCLLR